MRRTVERPRLWGIDVLAGIHALAAAGLIAVFVFGTWIGVVASLVLAPVTGYVAWGLFCRRNAARVVLLWLLGLSLFGYVVLAALFGAMLAGWINTPPNADPIEQLTRMPFRLGTALTMALYLRRADVRGAFGALRPLRDDEPDD